MIRSKKLYSIMQVTNFFNLKILILKIHSLIKTLFNLSLSISKSSLLLKKSAWLFFLQYTIPKICIIAVLANSAIILL